MRSAPRDEMAVRIPSMEASNLRLSWRFTIIPNNKKYIRAGVGKKDVKKYTTEASMSMKTNKNMTNCHQEKAKLKRK